MIWTIIKRTMKEIEARNKIEFANSAWDSFKQMERDILQVHRGEMEDLQRLYLEKIEALEKRLKALEDMNGEF